MKLFHIGAFLIMSCVIFGQDFVKLSDTNTRLYSIPTEQDTIQFLKLDTTVLFRKPVFIMLQGSLPIPLIIEDDKGKYLTSFPFSTKELMQSYHVINISMPHLPIEVTSDAIKGNGSMHDAPDAYFKDNYLGNYVRRTNKVISFLSNKIWVDTSEMIVFGHSQGSQVAIKVAKSNPVITKIGLSGCNPFGRYDSYIRRIRMEEHMGKLDSQEAQNQINEYYDRWVHYSKFPDDDTQKKRDTNKATFSFSEYLVDDLLEIKIPMHILYGSKDIGAIGCDYLPIEFERAGKKNYQMSVFPGLGHNYEEIDKKGRSDYDAMHWQKAIDSFINWIDTEKDKEDQP